MALRQSEVPASGPLGKISLPREVYCWACCYDDALGDPAPPMTPLLNMGSIPWITNVSTSPRWRKERPVSPPLPWLLSATDSMDKVPGIKVKAICVVVNSLLTNQTPGRAFSILSNRQGWERLAVHPLRASPWRRPSTFEWHHSTHQNGRVEREQTKIGSRCQPIPSPAAPPTLPLSRSPEAGSLMACAQPHLV